MPQKRPLKLFPSERRYLRKEKYTAIKEILENAELAGIPCSSDITYEDLYDLVNYELKLLQKRHEYELARGEKRRQQIDPLIEVAASGLTDYWQTLPQIAERINQPDVTAGKLTHRMQILIKQGIAERTNKGFRNNRKVVYRRKRNYNQKQH